jgi:hypothetical protein
MYTRYPTIMSYRRYDLLEFGDDTRMVLVKALRLYAAQPDLSEEESTMARILQRALTSKFIMTGETDGKD